MYCDHLKKKNLLDFCENLLENLLKSPKKSKSKSAMTPDLEYLYSFCTALQGVHIYYVTISHGWHFVRIEARV